MAELRYTPWGETRYTYGTTPTSYQYTGQRNDATGLYFYNARYYDPALGRFLAADSIVPDPANPQSLNRYAYALNNPLKYVDPSGHFTDDAIKNYLKDTYDNWELYWKLWAQNKSWMDLLHAANAGDFLVSMALDSSSSTFSTNYFQFNGDGETKLTGVSQVDRLGDGAQAGSTAELRSLYVGQNPTHGATLVQLADDGSVKVGAVIGTYAFASNRQVTQAEVDFENLAVGVVTWWATGGLGKMISLILGSGASLVTARLHAAGDNELTVGIYIPEEKLQSSPGYPNWAGSTITLRYGYMLSKEDLLTYVPHVNGHCWGCN